jgi:sugar phosphate isomerase/epimerase
MEKESQKQLRCYLNWLALDGMPVPNAGWMQAFREAGYDGIQLIEPLDLDLLNEARSHGFGVCGSGRVNHPSDAYRLAKGACETGLECLTLHVGWGLEDDDEAAQLIEAVLDASVQSAIPLYVETHRATLFQDIWRTVQFTRRFPQLQFNGDFSHWYTGLEMVYG